MKRYASVDSFNYQSVIIILIELSNTLFFIHLINRYTVSRDCSETLNVNCGLTTFLRASDINSAGKMLEPRVKDLTTLASESIDSQSPLRCATAKCCLRVAKKR